MSIALDQESAVKKKTKRDPREQTPKARELSLLSGSPHDHSLSSLHQKTEIRPHQRLLPRVSPEAAEHLKELRLPEKPTTSRADAVAATLSAPLVLLADASPGDSNQPFGNGSVVPTLLDEVSVGTAQCNKKVQPSAQINVKRSAPTFKPLSRTVPPPLRRHEQRTFQDTIESDVTYPLDWLDSLLARFTRLFRVSLPS